MATMPTRITGRRCLERLERLLEQLRKIDCGREPDRPSTHDDNLMTHRGPCVLIGCARIREVVAWILSASTAPLGHFAGLAAVVAGSSSAACRQGSVNVSRSDRFGTRASLQSRQRPATVPV